MKNKVPEGLSENQWDAIMDGLANHPSTMNDYRKIINLLHAFDNGRYHITSITKDEAKDYFAMLEKRASDGEMSSNTVHRYQATLRSIGKRIENHPETFPGYTNPFSGIMHNEVRSRTVFTEDMFASARDVEKIIRILPRFSTERQILLEMMLHLGLRPKQIENIRFSDFTVNPNCPDKELILTVPDGNYVEKAGSSAYRIAENAYTRLESVSANGNRSWNVTAIFRFYTAYSEKLKIHHPNLGRINDDRPYFMTARHQPYSYRALHHLVQEACVRAGLDMNAVTPYQLSLYGSINSYLLNSVLQDEQKLRRRLPKAKSREERNRILRELHEVNSRFLPLAKNGWIGCWVTEYPVNRRQMMREISSRLGEDFLRHAVGVV